VSLRRYSLCQYRAIPVHTQVLASCEMLVLCVGWYCAWTTPNSTRPRFALAENDGPLRTGMWGLCAEFPWDVDYAKEKAG